MEEKFENIRTLPGHPASLFGTEGLSDNSGWAGLVRVFLHKINDFNKDKSEEEKLKITQIKEKWGYLNIYTTGLPEEFDEDIKMREKASKHICEYCGSPFNVGKKDINNPYGWIRTICKKCAIEQGYYPDNWEEIYDSVKVNKFIRFCLKLNELYDKLKKWYESKIWYKWYIFTMNVKYFFNPEKYKNTIGNYKNKC